MPQSRDGRQAETGEARQGEPQRPFPRHHPRTAPPSNPRCQLPRDPVPLAAEEAVTLPLPLLPGARRAPIHDGLPGQALGVPQVLAPLRGLSTGDDIPVHEGQGARLARLAKLDRGLFDPYRRLWANERKGLSDVDVAYAGGWKDTRAMKLSYHKADPATVLRVIQHGG